MLATMEETFPSFFLIFLRPVPITFILFATFRVAQLQYAAWAILLD